MWLCPSKFFLFFFVFCLFSELRTMTFEIMHPGLVQLLEGSFKLEKRILLLIFYILVIVSFISNWKLVSCKSQVFLLSRSCYKVESADLEVEIFSSRPKICLCLAWKSYFLGQTQRVVTMVVMILQSHLIKMFRIILGS